MRADRPRAWQYMGAEPFAWAGADSLTAGDHYVATEPLTPDDIPLAPPVEVTEEDVDFALEGNIDRDAVPYVAGITDVLTERLAARQEGE